MLLLQGGLQGPHIANVAGQERVRGVGGSDVDAQQLVVVALREDASTREKRVKVAILQEDVVLGPR